MRSRRLLLIGVILIAVVAPLSLGGVITCFVQARIHHHLNAVSATLLGLWALVSVVLVLAGFGALIAGVFTGWRQRCGQDASLAHMSDSA